MKDDGKWQVDKLLDRRGKWIQVLKMGAEPAAVLAKFDRPQDLAVFDDSDGTLKICRASDLPMIKRQIVELGQLVDKYGLASIDEYESLKSEKREAFLAEAQAIYDAAEVEN